MERRAYYTVHVKQVRTLTPHVCENSGQTRKGEIFDNKFVFVIADKASIEGKISAWRLNDRFDYSY